MFTLEINKSYRTVICTFLGLYTSLKESLEFVNIGSFEIKSQATSIPASGEEVIHLSIKTKLKGSNPSRTCFLYAEN